MIYTKFHVQYRACQCCLVLRPQTEQLADPMSLFRVPIPPLRTCRGLHWASTKIQSTGKTQ